MQRFLIHILSLLILLSGCTSSPEKGSVLNSDDPWAGVTLPGTQQERDRRMASERISATETGSEAVQRIRQKLPARVRDPEGWAKDIATAFSSLQLEPSSENLCAVLAVTEQESGYQADPPVAGLSRIVRMEIDQRLKRFGIPEGVVRTALRTKKSPNGATYDQRIDALRTENDLNRLYGDMTSELPFGRTLLAGFNPVRTGGPMQVSLKYAEKKINESTYPYPISHGLREELFTRRGGLYFGIAYLLDYPAHYPQMLYRFADYNAGHYASRNAAFQQAISELSGQTMDLDGDLLRYDGDGSVSVTPSQTLAAIVSLQGPLGLTEEEIKDDLALEKQLDFEKSRLYTETYRLMGTRGKPASRAVLPQIRLHSPKITSHLTTAKFASRVNGRYQSCLSR